MQNQYLPLLSSTQIIGYCTWIVTVINAIFMVFRPYITYKLSKYWYPCRLYVMVSYRMKQHVLLFVYAGGYAAHKDDDGFGNNHQAVFVKSLFIIC